jgi:mono/diheme cytochrome c family protein
MKHHGRGGATLGWSAGIVALTVGVATVAACSSHDDPNTESDDNGADDSALVGASEGFYHWTEGSESFPLFALRALEVDVDGKTVSFMSAENLARYGLLADATSASNPEGLPVGLTLARAADTALVSVGVNCAACHVADITVPTAGGRKTIRVDGAPSHFDFDRFNRDAVDAFKAQLGTETTLWDKGKFAARAIKEAGRVSAHYRDYDGSPDSAWAEFKKLITVLFHAVGVLQGDIHDVIHGFQVPAKRARLLLARYHTLRALYNRADEFQSGPGRNDPNSGGPNYLFGGFGYHVVPHTPMRYQPLFGIAGKSAFQYTANTNTVMTRNLAQAAAAGGITDLYGNPPTLQTSVQIGNLVKLEQAAYAIKTPAWPQELGFDAALASRGKAIYDAKCAGCHEPKAGARGLYDVTLTPLADVNTDDHAIRQFLDPIVTPFGGRTNFGGQLNAMAPKMLERYCAEANLSPTACLALNDTYDATDNPTGRRESPRFATDATGYQADILDGVWAYGRYLHNGSVPSVADLLEPSSDRPRQFAVGHRVYDPARLGYALYPTLSDAAKAEGATTLFDVTQPGSSNVGHEGDRYGTNLAAGDKKSLLEYLKTHRSRP